jgi:beta-lactamase superfamily II metal-dependent hydrolase
MSPFVRIVPFLCSAALVLAGCGPDARVRRAPRPAPTLPAGETTVAAPAPPASTPTGEAAPPSAAPPVARPEAPPPEVPELQVDEGKVHSGPGEPLVVLENPPRGNDLGGLLGTPTGAVMVLHFTDVGQGDGAVLQTPSGKTVVIDTGPPPGCPRFMRYLGDLEIHHVDLLINTHPHADHMGCSTLLMKEMTVGTVLESGYAHPTPDYDNMLKQMEADKIPLKLARKGRNIELEPGITLEVLGPEEPLISGSRSDANANSVVFRLVYRELSFLFVGDAEEDTEERLLRSAGSKLRSSVLKVAHHGSAYASSSEFLSHVRPKLAVLSYGKNNVYGHPAPATVQRLEREGAHLLKTGQDGNIVMVTDGSVLQVWTVPRYGGPYGGARLWYPGRPAVKESTAGPHGGPEVVAAPKKVDLNHATVEELTRLPAIGKKMAEKIVESRRSGGRYNSVEDLKREKLRPYVTCGPGVTY